ncbi:hypothetical protein [Streptomyces sp. enrichment culture]|uniref:hypothetical protein n=1 Tax=Streptomyces sp. enrichment culture TaxID=1795815 RepID=UPI003F56C3A5
MCRNRNSATTSRQARTVLERFPAGGPRSSWPAEEYAPAQRAQRISAQVVTDLPTGQIYAITDTTTQ